MEIVLATTLLVLLVFVCGQLTKKTKQKKRVEKQRGVCWANVQNKQRQKKAF